MADFKTIIVEDDNNPVECTVFSDGMLMIKDGENDTILISEEQLVSIYKQLKGV
jgi:hypothetical protein